MAEVSTNAGVPTVLEEGGIIRILAFNGGSDDAIIKAYEPASLSVTPGGHDYRDYSDRNVLQQPLMGAEQPTQISLTIKATTSLVADDMMSFLVPNGNDATNAGKVPEHTIEIDFPDYRGATAGQRLTLANCSVRGRVINTGEKFDTIQITLSSRSVKPALAAYPGA